MRSAASPRILLGATAAALALLVAGLSVTALADRPEVDGPQPQHHHLAAAESVPAAGAPMSCSPADRRAALTHAQRTVAHRLGALTTLRGPADLERLAAIGYDSFPHWHTSLGRVGWTVSDLDRIRRPEPGMPAMLNYRPDEDAADDAENGPHDGLDFPYVLAGWTYLAPYDPAQVPTRLLPCVRPAEWFVHERGIHRHDNGGFLPVPPVEQRYGSAPGAQPLAAEPPNYGHPRSWDLHVWMAPSGTPTVSIRNPGRPISGLDVPPGTFFHPPPQWF